MVLTISNTTRVWNWVLKWAEESGLGFLKVIKSCLREDEVSFIRVVFNWSFKDNGTSFEVEDVGPLN